jgi:hypothetical protein
MIYPFCGADSVEEYEVRIKTEPVIIDSEMIERGDTPLFMSVYDRMFLKNTKRKPIETKTDAEIVDDIFKQKLIKKKESSEKPKGLSAFQKKDVEKVKEIKEIETSRTPENLSDNSDAQFIISLFK